MTLPVKRKIRRPKISLFAPERRNPRAFAVVYAGTYQYALIGEPSFRARVPCKAEVAGTGHQESPKVEESTYIQLSLVFYILKFRRVVWIIYQDDNPCLGCDMNIVVGCWW
jgi:hypothetical protein